MLTCLNHTLVKFSDPGTQWRVAWVVSNNQWHPLISLLGNVLKAFLSGLGAGFSPSLGDYRRVVASCSELFFKSIAPLMEELSFGAQSAETKEEAVGKVLDDVAGMGRTTVEISVNISGLGV